MLPSEEQIIEIIKTQTDLNITEQNTFVINIDEFLDGAFDGSQEVTFALP